MTTMNQTDNLDDWTPFPEDQAPEPGPNDVTVDIELTNPKSVAYGTATATRPADGVDYTHSGDFTKAGTRKTFARGAAAVFYLDPGRAEGEDDAAFAGRRAAVEGARAVAESRIGQMLQGEVSRLRRERRELEAEAEERAAGRLPDEGGGVREIAGTPEAPKVLCDVDEHRVTAEVIATLATDPNLYHRGGKLVRVGRERSATVGETAQRRPDSPVIQALPLPSLREKISRHATLTELKKTKNGDLIEVLTHPPAWLVEQVYNRGAWPGIRPLVGIAEAPFLRSDGTVCQTAGFDVASCVLYEPSGEFPAVAPDVDLDDASAAVDALLEVVQDFRFESPEHRAAYVAGLLTPLARFAFEGPSPLHLVDANIRGAGKGLLVQTIGHILTGGELPVNLYTPDVDEMRKKITTIALNGDRFVVLDNVEGTLGNPSLDAALTTTRWQDRLLSKNENPGLPLLATWYATGNNVIIGGDTARRTIHIRLKVLEERPEDRTDFHHKDLLGWIRRERPRLLTAALTILSAYCNAGRPEQDARPLGSYGGWCALVQQAIVWAGLPDPVRTQFDLAARSDQKAETLRQVIEAWRAYDFTNRGLFVSQVVAHLYPQDRQATPRGDDALAMRAAIESLVTARPGSNPTARQVASALKGLAEQVCDDVYLKCDPDHTKYGQRWRLHPARPGANVGGKGDSGDGGE